MKRVLIVVSAYAPAMIADMQRARMLAWELPKLDWKVEILTPDSTEVRQDVIEQDAGVFFNPDVRVHQVRSLGRSIFRMGGLQSHAWPTFLPMRQAGLRVLRSKPFDLVYLTTTSFNYFVLGAMWRKSTGVPYVLDYHDPWVPEAPRHRQDLKSQINHQVSVSMERKAIAGASGIVSVSPNYLTSLKAKYQGIKRSDFFDRCTTVIPFGCRAEDFDVVSNKDRSPLEIVYVGAGGGIMRKGFGVLCHTIALLRQDNSELLAGIKFRFYGTGYCWSPGEPKELSQVAEEHGVSDFVEEDPRRVSYRKSVELLMQGAGALILGVNDHGYMPSKLFPYSISGKPLLASVHRQSPAFSCLERQPELGNTIWFDDKGQIDANDAKRILVQFLTEVRSRQRFDRRQTLSCFTSSAMAQNHSNFFMSCLSTP